MPPAPTSPPVGASAAPGGGATLPAAVPSGGKAAAAGGTLSPLRSGLRGFLSGAQPLPDAPARAGSSGIGAALLGAKSPALVLESSAGGGGEGGAGGGGEGGVGVASSLGSGGCSDSYGGSGSPLPVALLTAEGGESGSEGVVQGIEALSRDARSGRPVCLGDFDLHRVLGKGSYGKVLLVRPRAGVVHLRDEPLAMKVLSKAHVVARRQVEHTQAERAILESVDHPFLQRLRYAFQTPVALYLVTPFLPGGELFHHLRAAGRFSEPLARFYVAEVVLAVGHLHSLDVVYRDLKPENILLDAQGHVKLTDFGLSKVLSGPTATTLTFCGTPEYVAPEVIAGAPHGRGVDWWALGVFAWELLAGAPPFSHPNPQALYALIASHTTPLLDGAFPPHFSAPARALLRELLQHAPDRRLGCKPGDGGVRAIQAHPFFAGVDWAALAARRVAPPWTPAVRSDDDTTNFEAVESSGGGGGGGSGGAAVGTLPNTASSLPLDDGTVAAVFEGFTYMGTPPFLPLAGGGSLTNAASSLPGVEGQRLL